MGRLNERVSFLRGLAEGLEISNDTREGKLLLQIVDVMGDFALEVERQGEEQEELSEYVDRIDEDLTELEGELTDEDEDAPRGTGKDGQEDDEDEGGYIQMTCPHCNEEIVFPMEEFDMQEEPVCPHCSKPLFQDEE